MTAREIAEEAHLNRGCRTDMFIDSLEHRINEHAINIAHKFALTLLPSTTSYYDSAVLRNRIENRVDIDIRDDI